MISQLRCKGKEKGFLVEMQREGEEMLSFCFNSNRFPFFVFIHLFFFISLDLKSQLLDSNELNPMVQRHLLHHRGDFNSCIVAIAIKHRFKIANEERVVNLNYENLNKIELGLPMNIELTFVEMKYIDFVDLIIKIPDFDPEAEVETTRVLVRQFFQHS